MVTSGPKIGISDRYFCIISNSYELDLHKKKKFYDVFVDILKERVYLFSSSHSSPPSSELCTRISDSDNTHRRSPSDSTLSANNHPKLEPPRNEILQRFSPSLKNFLQNDLKHNFNVPIFVLHAKGSYYVPLTVDYKTLLPFLQNYDILEAVPGMQNVVLHPVTINVNFLPNYNNDVTNSKYKSEYSNSWH